MKTGKEFQDFITMKVKNSENLLTQKFKEGTNLAIAKYIVKSIKDGCFDNCIEDQYGEYMDAGKGLKDIFREWEIGIYDILFYDVSNYDLKKEEFDDIFDRVIDVFGLEEF